MRVPIMKQTWEEIKASRKPGPQFKDWEDKDEEELQRLKNKEILMADTAAGRLAETNKRQLEATWKEMSPASKQSMYKRLINFEGQGIVPSSPV